MHPCRSQDVDRDEEWYDAFLAPSLAMHAADEVAVSNNQSLVSVLQGERPHDVGEAEAAKF